MKQIKFEEVSEEISWAVECPNCGDMCEFLDNHPEQDFFLNGEYIYKCEHCLKNYQLIN